MKPILFSKKTYVLTVIGCFTTLIVPSILLAGLLPSKPRIDYQVFYGSDYLIYILSNWIMLASLVSLFLCMGLLMAEKLIWMRGYYEIILLEKTRKENKGT